jgi:hypothetical protein
MGGKKKNNPQAKGPEEAAVVGESSPAKTQDESAVNQVLEQNNSKESLSYRVLTIYTRSCSGGSEAGGRVDLASRRDPVTSSKQSCPSTKAISIETARRREKSPEFSSELLTSKLLKESHQIADLQAKSSSQLSSSHLIRS